MKIGFFTDAYFPQVNGVVTSVYETTKGLRKRGHEVVIIAPFYPNYNDTKKDNVIRLSSIPIHKKLNIRLATYLPDKNLRNLYKDRFDIIHAHGGGTISLLGLEIAKIKKIPYVFTYHTLFSKYAHYILKGLIIRPKMIEALSRIFCNRCDIVIAPTSKIKEILASYGVKKPIVVIPTGLDIKKFKVAKKGYLRGKFKIKDKNRILLFVGRLGKEKSVDFLIKAFKIVSGKNKNTVLLIVGEGPEKKNLQDLAKSFGLQDKVYFLGNIDSKNMPQVYKDAEIFLFASTTETQGLVILEAMASGLPVVVVDDPAVADVIKNNKNGIISNRNTKNYAEKTLQLLDNNNLRKIIAKNVLLDVQKFSIVKTVDSLEKLYSDHVTLSQPLPIRLISVVIPAYNEEAYLENCLAALKKQNYKGEFETILVDNNSTDKTSQIAKKFGVKVVVEKKQGYVFALKRGMNMAHGDIIAVTDADSQVAADWLLTIKKIFSEPGVVAATGLADVNTKSKLADISIATLYAIFMHVSAFIGKPNLSGFNFAVRKDAFLKAGGLNTLFEMSPDVDLGLRLAKIKKVETVNDLRVLTSVRRFEKRFMQSLWEYAKGYVYATWLRKPPKFRQKPIR